VPLCLFCLLNSMLLLAVFTCLQHSFSFGNLTLNNDLSIALRFDVCYWCHMFPENFPYSVCMIQRFGISRFMTEGQLDLVKYLH